MRKPGINKKIFLLSIIFLLHFGGDLILAQLNVNADSLYQQLCLSKNATDSVPILSRLAWNAANQNPEIAIQYGIQILKMTSRIRNNEILSEAYDAAGLAYNLKGEREKAKEYYKKSLTLGEKYNYPWRIAWGNYNLAEIYKNEKNYDEVFKHAEKSRAAFNELNNIRMVINSDWLLINTQKNNNNVYLDSAITDYDIAGNYADDSEFLLDKYLNLSSIYTMKGDNSHSMNYALKALDIAETIENNRGIIKAYYRIGNYLRDTQHNYNVALLYYEKVLEIYRKEKNDQGVADILIEIGNIHKMMENDSLALGFYKRSLTIAKKIKHRHLTSTAYKHIGEISYRKKNFQDALKYYLKAYNTGCDVCPQIAFHQVLIDVGNVYINMRDYVKALEYFNKSLSLADSSKAPFEKVLSNSALGDFCAALNNHRRAFDYYNQAFDLAAEANSLLLRKEISEKLSALYNKVKNYQKAYEFLLTSDMLADSLNKLNTAENLSRLEMQFEFQNLKLQQEHELKESQLISQTEIEKQSQLKYFFIIAFLLTATFGIMIYRGFTRNKKDNLILARQKDQIEKMSEKIHDADQKKLSFFTNISHELRTPLTLILGPAEKLLKENPENNNITPMLGIIRRNTLHLYNLINQLLDIRKLDTGNIKLKVSRGDIINYGKGIFASFKHLSEEKNIIYEFHSIPENLAILFDRDIINKTLNNLLSNAFKYTPAGGKITLLVTDLCENGNNNSSLTITVSDTGTGIPADQLQYIFDRYYQVENTNTGFNTGTGIGLAYTKELIELHHGEIKVINNDKGGTTFSIKLPIHDSAYSTGEKVTSYNVNDDIPFEEIRDKYLTEIISAEKENKCEEKYSNNDDRNILLIVEDNHDLRTFIKSIFENEFIVYEAEDGNQGFTKALELIPDIIISDIMMPGMNGLELCNKLKNNHHTNHIPVLILTAKTGEENEIEGLKTGADDYLTKPFSPEILEMRINRLIASRERFREFFTKEFLLNPKDVKLSSREDEFLRNAVKIVEDNISNPDLNVEKLMSELGVSRTQLFRKLKAITNYSANQFIRNIKLKRAAYLLQQKSYNITEVLYMSGFNSPSYFTTCFKEFYGCLPKEYQKKEVDSISHKS